MTTSHDGRTRGGSLFICGFPSSGTDLLKNIVNAHSEIHVGGEFPLLPSLAGRYGARVAHENLERALADLRRMDVYGNLENADFTPRIGNRREYAFSSLYLDLLTNSDAAWKGNKTPQNAERIRDLEQLFPDARFLVVVRDIRDVALSWHRKWGKNMVLCADKWNRRMRACMRHLGAMSPDRYEIVRYEDLLTGPATVVERICTWLAVEPEPKMLRFHETVERIVPGKLNYGKPIIRGNAQKWRHEMIAKDVLRIEQVAFDAMRELGYEPACARYSRPITWPERVLGVGQDLWAIVAIGNRALEERRLSYRLRTIRLELMKWMT